MEQHLLVPLDADHQRAARQLADAAAAAAGLGPAAAAHHITVVRFESADGVAAQATIEAVAQRHPPFVLRAHGYGIFVDGTVEGTSLHVPIVASPALTALHGALCAALRDLGAVVSSWTDPDHWTPHVTLLDDGLAPERLGAVVTHLARRHHPHWTMPVDRLVLAGARRSPTPQVSVPLGT